MDLYNLAHRLCLWVRGKIPPPWQQSWLARTCWQGETALRQMFADADAAKSNGDLVTANLFFAALLSMWRSGGQPHVPALRPLPPTVKIEFECAAESEGHGRYDLGILAFEGWRLCIPGPLLQESALEAMLEKAPRVPRKWGTRKWVEKKGIRHDLRASWGFDDPRLLDHLEPFLNFNLPAAGEPEYQALVADGWWGSKLYQPSPRTRVAGAYKEGDLLTIAKVGERVWAASGDRTPCCDGWLRRTVYQAGKRHWQILKTEFFMDSQCV